MQVPRYEPPEDARPSKSIKKEKDENIHKMTKETVRKGTKKLIDQSRWTKHEEICKEVKIAYLA